MDYDILTAILLGIMVRGLSSLTVCQYKTCGTLVNRYDRCVSILGWATNKKYWKILILVIETRDHSRDHSFFMSWGLVGFEERACKKYGFK